MPWPVGVRIMWAVYRAAVAAEVIQYLRDLYGSDADDEQPELAVRRLHVIWEREGSAASEDDRAMITMDFLKMDGGSFSDEWDNDDFTTLEALVDTWWAAVKTAYNTNTILREYRWYRKVPGIGQVGNPRRIVARNVPGTAGTVQLPPQVAITVTERTALRKHWGRIYLPAPVAGQLASGGRLGTGHQALFGGNTATLFDAAGDEGYIPVVVSDSMRAALAIREVQLDDIIDVQRSRRYRTPLFRHRIALNA